MESMRMYDLIHAKKSGRALSAEQIAFWVKGVTQGIVPDEQSSALLMAICWRGMNTEETLALTLNMRDSGHRADLSSVPGIKVDKHSTGGVGDKTTLILGPIVAACGLKCAMFSGRGLGHTGGTVDKFAAIPGLKVELTEAEFIASLAQVGFVNSAPTGDFCPADRKLYALRDVTATVESIPLITASIMSKKLAGGADALILDVKCGSGAFMSTLEDATTLARSMVDVGKAHGMKIKALITRMDEPLGWAIGNSLEVMESVEILRGQHGNSVLALESFRLAAEMLMLGGLAKNLEGALAKVNGVVVDGSAFELLKRFVAMHGGDATALDDFNRLPQAPRRVEIKSDQAGFVQSIDSRALGILAMELGAGRRSKDDVLDYGVGIRVHVHTGDQIAKGQTLLTLHASDRPLPQVGTGWIRFSDKAIPDQDWLLGMIE